MPDKSARSSAPFRRPGSAAILLACLASAAVADWDLFVVPVVTEQQAPVVDGHMEAGEWDRAVGLSGLLGLTDGNLAQRQVTVHYLADDQHLYVGMRAPSIPPGTAPSMPAPGDAGTDWASYDRVEVKFAPPANPDTAWFYLIANAAERLVDSCQDRKTGKEDGAWEGRWRFKSSYDRDGWTIELAAALTDFGVSALKPDEAWGLNFSRVWKFPQQYTGLRRGPHELASASFVAGAPAVQIERLGNLPAGALDLAVSVRGHEGTVTVPKEGAYDTTPVPESQRAAGEGRRVSFTCALLDGARQTLWSEERQVPVAAGRKERAEFRHTFVPGATNALVLRAVEQPGERVLGEATLPFTRFNEAEGKEYAKRLTQGAVIGSWRFLAGFFPYWEKAKVRAILFEGRLKEQAARLTVRIRSDQGFEAAAEAPVVRGESPDLDLPIPGLPEAEYVAVGELRDAGGQVLDRKEVRYARRAFPWEHNTLGLTRRVIKPWIPMTVRGADVGLWGRTYTLNAMGLPQAVVSQGRDVLAGPLRLEARYPGGREAAAVPEGELAFVEKAPDRVRWKGQGRFAGGLGVEVSGLAEYDGYTEWTLTLRPHGTTTVERLAMTIPVREETASLMHVQGSGARGNFSGAIPLGRGTVYDSLKQATSHLPGGFVPHVWVGNLHRGLSWFAESDEGWVSVPVRPALEIVREPGRVAIRLNVINRPAVLAAPRTLGMMGLMATPFKPLLPIRNIRTRAVNWLFPRGINQYCQYAPYPEAMDYARLDADLKALAEQWECEGIRLYFNKHELGAAMPEVPVFDYEWGGLEPGEAYPASLNRFGPVRGMAIGRALTDSRVDMMVYYIAELARKTRLAGTYWDITGIYADLPLLENGSAYRNDEGRLVAKFCLARSRQLFKRVATAWQDVRGEPDSMEIHSTNHMGLPFYSFAYAWLNFEWLWPNEKVLRPDGRVKDFIDLRPLDLMATEGVPSQFGVWIASINGGYRPPDPPEARRIVRSGEALAVLHNHFTGPGPSFGPRDAADFIGYWDEGRRIRTDHDLVKASLWHKGLDAELAVVNLSLSNMEATVTADLAALGWKGVEHVTNVDTNDRQAPPRPTAARGGAAELRLTVDAHDYRVLRMRGK